MTSQTKGVALAEEPSRVEAALWRRLRANGELACRQNLFTKYRELACGVARREYRRRPSYGLERTDFEQLAYAGLLDAIDQFDPLRGVPFSGYARHRITGAISDGIASSSEQGAQYTSRKRAEADRLRSLKRQGGDPMVLLSDLAMGLAIGVMLEGTSLIEPEDGTCHRPDAYESLSWRELQHGLIRAIEKLPPSERVVICEHYREGLAFTQIAALLGVSKGRVSQIHKAAIGRLQRSMSAFA